MPADCKLSVFEHVTAGRKFTGAKPEHLAFEKKVKGFMSSSC